MEFKRHSYYLYNGKVKVKFDHAPLQKFCTAHTLNLKVKKFGNWNFENEPCYFQTQKGTENILPDWISHLRYMALYNCLDPEGEGKEFGHDISEELPFISPELSTQTEWKEMKIYENTSHTFKIRSRMGKKVITSRPPILWANWKYEDKKQNS